MNIQIFGKTKCFDTKKAERYFKERGIKYQYIDLKEKGMSKGELNAVCQAVGGLDEANFAVAYNDVDFCLRLREKGWRIVWTPYAELYHHESKSRGSDEEDPAKKARFAKEQARLYEVHGKQNILHDPYYNPNLSLDYEDFRESGDLRNLKNVTL